MGEAGGKGRGGEGGRGKGEGNWINLADSSNPKLLAVSIISELHISSNSTRNGHRMTSDLYDSRLF